jgi:DNA-binding response OmpR family regulator
VTGRTQPTVLVVDDDHKLIALVRMYLERDGFTVVPAYDGRQALDLFARHRPGFVILDVMLPEMDGVAVCRALRKRSEVPILMLTARVEESDKLSGLAVGADDYVTKPFSPRELAVRVRNLLKRATTAPVLGASMHFGDVELDAEAREVRKAGVPLRLTLKEFDLLWFLASHPRRVFSRDQLMESVWGYSSALDTGTVTVHVRRLREKIEDDPSHPRHLETVWGAGYRFSP